MTLIWLDDCRDPRNGWIKFSPIGIPENLIWVKSYDEFINQIKENGLPDGICFDHDLGDQEKTGYDCAKWLVKYCLERYLPLPKWNIQSANPVGKENIRSLLQNYDDFFI